MKDTRFSRILAAFGLIRIDEHGARVELAFDDGYCEGYKAGWRTGYDAGYDEAEEEFSHVRGRF